MPRKQTCAELVDLVKARGIESLDGKTWLDELVDINGAAAFTGLAVTTVRTWHGRARRIRAYLDTLPAKQRKAEAPQWMWPAPELEVAGHPAWTLRTLVIARASMPGRGAGGGRPWWKERERANAAASSSSS